jgi:hypothetical protein
MISEAPPQATFVPRVLAAIVAVPVALATIAVLVFSVLDSRGEPPLSDGPARNVAEAAALGQASEVLRFLRAGQDPHRVWPVRRDIVSSTITQVTALEAAVWSRRVELIELLDREGAIGDRGSRRHMGCLASDLPSAVEEIVEYLSKDAPLDCPRGEALAAVVERSKENQR